MQLIFWSIPLMLSYFLVRSFGRCDTWRTVSFWLRNPRTYVALFALLCWCGMLLACSIHLTLLIAIPSRWQCLEHLNASSTGASSFNMPWTNSNHMFLCILPGSSLLLSIAERAFSLLLVYLKCVCRFTLIILFRSNPVLLINEVTEGIS